MLVDVEGDILDCAGLDPVLGVMLMEPMEIGEPIGELYVILLLGVLLMPPSPVGLESFLTPPATTGVPTALFITVVEEFANCRLGDDSLVLFTHTRFMHAFLILPTPPYRFMSRQKTQRRQFGCIQPGHSPHRVKVNADAAPSEIKIKI